MLGYTATTISDYETATITATIDVTSMYTQTDMVTTATVTTATASTAPVYGKRQVAAGSALVTPTALGSYSDDFLYSACAIAVPTPSTSTDFITATYGVTATSVVSVTTTVAATTTTVIYPTQILADGSFELNSGAWTFTRVSELGTTAASDGTQVADFNLVKNNFAYAYQRITLDLSLNYTLSYNYRINTLPSTCIFNTYNNILGGITQTGTLGSWTSRVQQILASESSTDLDSVLIEFYITCTVDSNADVWLDNVVLAADPPPGASSSSSSSSSSTVSASSTISSSASSSISSSTTSTVSSNTAVHS